MVKSHQRFREPKAIAYILNVAWFDKQPKQNKKKNNNFGLFNK